MPKVKTEAPDLLTTQQRSVLRAWQRERFPNLSAAELADLVEECLDWHRAEGRRRVDWIATCRNWVRKEMRFRGERERAAIQRGNAKRINAQTQGDKWEAYAVRNGGLRHPNDPRGQN